MRAGRSLWIGLVVAFGGIGASAAVLQARDARFPDQPMTERLLYLRSGGVADRVMLQFDALAADVYWIRTIQYYGRDLRSSRPDRFALLEPLLDLTTTLDPHFNIAYRFGAIFLAYTPPYGAGRVDQAVALLEKGLARDPARWQYAHDIGFVYYWFSGDYIEAARWFERAGEMPGAPEWILPLSAVTRLQGGDRNGARTLLESLVESPESYVRAAAERGLLQLRALDDLDELGSLVGRFAEEHGRQPAALAELFPARPGGPQLVPLDPTGLPYAYDPARGVVTLASESRLNPLPDVPRGK